ncbi:hypothetical protein [Phytomonospora endophytica]|uniref:Uncharacterized protein n=1 Tax=Phytomonospora endophytica TaxID=714109 RepID=A0A841FTQ6_9ACTN|nr:hypothetical protein [Phytomonospora endophytica]MBB6036717.1 hypothetical protein [Phytomonospora endophytica]GIG68249.1 hypothetical protein Pen01_45440 [Phytomonospora endophytica]
MTDDPERTFALAWKNRRIFAVRENWPAGALESCEAIEREFPDVHPVWHKGGLPGAWGEAGFYGTVRGLPGAGRTVFAPTADELRATLAARPARGTSARK